MTNNFSQVMLAINSSALNSENYGQSSIKSQNVQANAVLAQHLSAAGFPNAKFSSRVLVADNFNYRSAAGGVDFIRIGLVASKMPANGVRLGVYSFTMPNTATNSAYVSTRVYWSNAIHGNPSFSTTPIAFGVPAFVVHSTSGSSPLGVHVYSMGSQSCIIMARLTDATPQTFTVNFMVAGAAST
jgi:hypothetical protein